MEDDVRRAWLSDCIAVLLFVSRLNPRAHRRPLVGSLHGRLNQFLAFVRSSLVCCGGGGSDNIKHTILSIAANDDPTAWAWAEIGVDGTGRDGTGRDGTGRDWDWDWDWTVLAVDVIDGDS